MVAVVELFGQIGGVVGVEGSGRAGSAGLECPEDAVVAAIRGDRHRAAAPVVGLGGFRGRRGGEEAVAEREGLDGAGDGGEVDGAVPVDG